MSEEVKDIVLCFTFVDLAIYYGVKCRLTNLVTSLTEMLGIQKIFQKGEFIVELVD